MEHGDSNKLDKFLTVGQIASCLQVSCDYVYSLINQGTLAGIKLPGKFNDPVRISTNSVHKFIASCTVCKIKKDNLEQKVSMQASEQQVLQQIPVQGDSCKRRSKSVPPGGQLKIIPPTPYIARTTPAVNINPFLLTSCVWLSVCGSAQGGNSGR